MWVFITEKLKQIIIKKEKTLLMLRAYLSHHINWPGILESV
jgi:hypothetical protein